MTDVWSGTFTFLLTDIEGSTRMWEAAPADMARALVRHDDLISSIVPAHGGRLVRSRGEGDSAFAAFTNTASALRCAVELQRALHLEPWPVGTPIRVRMAVHAGPAQARGDDFYGPGVNRAARIRSIAHGGQLLVSEDAQREIAGDLPGDMWLTDLGLHRLKDLTRPERIWQIGHRDLTVDFPPLRSLDARGHNLPVQLTTFIGRELDVLGVRKRLESSALVTLAGGGGIGKTRLALQAAAECVDDFPDGVWLVELAAINRDDLVVASMARVLGVREEAGREIAVALREHVLDKQLLIVLDNCEHVIDGAARAAHKLLQAAAGLRILATSREPLRVYGEAIVGVAPMEVPTIETAFPEEAMASDAVRLFVDRAGLADAGFTIGADAEDVVRICRRLEGIPLAIELAAAMVRTASPHAIAERLDDRLGSLDEGPRTAPVRQQTLRATIGWSYDLLDTKERLVFERVAVFSGGCSPDAAATVVSSDDLEAEDVQTMLDRLVDRSLLSLREDDDHVRYTMLDTVREFALGQSAERGDLDDVRRRHGAWAGAFGAQINQLVRGPTGPQGMAAIAREQDNIRAATEFALETGDEDATSRLVRGVFYFWFVRGQYSEGRAWIARALEVFPSMADRATLLLYDGQFANSQGDVMAAVPILEESIGLARKAGDKQTVGIGLNALATSALQLGHLDDVMTYGQEALTLLRAGTQPHSVAQSLNILGVAAALFGDEPAARNYYEDALAISREIGMKENVARLLMNLGNMALARTDHVRAREYYHDARETALSIGDAQTASGALANLGVTAKAAGDYPTAQALLTEALSEKRSLGDGRGMIVATSGLGDLHRREGRFVEALDALAESIELCRELSYVLGIIQGLEAITSVCADAGAWLMDGLRLAAAASAARDRSTIRRNELDALELERALQVIRDALGPQAYQDIWDEGSRLDADAAAGEAVSFARTEAAARA